MPHDLSTHAARALLPRLPRRLCVFRALSRTYFPVFVAAAHPPANSRNSQLCSTQIVQYTTTTTGPAGPMTNVVVGGGMYGPGVPPGASVSPAYVPASAYPPRPTAATSGLMPGAETYYQPYVKPGEAIAQPGDADGGPMSAWGDLLERMTRELSTDTMEIANLDNQVLHPLATLDKKQNTNNMRCLAKSKRHTYSKTYLSHVPTDVV